ncbi:uncharacterized protein LOC128672587 [Plodia interpunctella]|uniref:uncharacterized protein LOC128672587 n=1 Tax=Plodia interpunctella TaxID=58824 RepID=UPI002367DB04|nr:uncharacterized protein LOC128672587 [Plodia interpunctella]
MVVNMMVYLEINNNCDMYVSGRTLSIRSSKLLCVCNIVYAGLLVLFVPSVFCDRDIFQKLSYEDIFNNTKYAQLSHRPRPYDLQDFSNHISYSAERENSLETYREGDESQSQLLVGFSRDPFRHSVPEEQFSNGFRLANTQPSRKENRGKRGVFHLYNMIYCATGCEPLIYKGYGCYCGFLGSGRPTDGIDRCCKMHDECYENLFCPFFTVYFQPYYWKCYRNQPLCARENYHTVNQLINGCAAKLCECDRKLAMCLQNYSCPKRRALCTSSPLRLLQNLLIL